MLEAFLAGLLTSAGLIIAIGAQNAFVLRQAIRREHVAAVVAVCAVSDALLISLGIAGLGALIQQYPLLLSITQYGGALFLIVYGALAFRRAMRPSTLRATQAEAMTLSAAVGTALALTYLNPHVYLDTVVLLGAIANQYSSGANGQQGRWLFGCGAALASLIWFVALGFGGRHLAGVFASPKAWQLLDFSIALIMWAIAITLLVR